MTQQSLHKIFIGCGSFLLGCLIVSLAWQTAQRHAAQEIAQGLRLHNADYSVKAILDTSDLTWIGRVFEGEDSGKYELVRIRSGQETVISTFPYNEGTSSQFDHDGGGLFRFTYSASPGEAFAELTTIVFDREGEETMRETHSTDGGSIIFQAPHKAPHSVTLRTDGGCTDGTVGSPKTTLHGITITSGGQATNFDLPSPEVVSCATGYGDAVIDPWVSDVYINTGILVFKLPSGERAEISLENGYPRKVEFTMGVATDYTWEPWGISFDLPSGMKVGKVGDEMLVVNETGVLPDGDVPQMKVYLKKNTTLAAVEASYEKEENFSRSEALINDHRVTTVNYDDGFAGPDTAYLVQIDNNVMEYRLAHAVGTAGYEHDDLVADVVLRSLNF